MNRMKSPGIWFWLLTLALLWPATFLAYTMSMVLSTGGLPSAFMFLRTWLSDPYLGQGMAYLLVFVPMSLVAAVPLLHLWSRAQTRAERVGLCLGYVLASPLAFLGALFSPLLWPPLLGTVLYGSLSLVAGTLIGHTLATNRSSHLRTLAWLWVVYSTAYLLGALGGYFFFWKPTIGVTWFLSPWALLFIPGLVAGLAGLGGLVWSRYLLLLAAVVNLVWFPAGTLVAIYTVVVLALGARR